jgi:mono/diheme cytochrome c family protein
MANQKLTFALIIITSTLSCQKPDEDKPLADCSKANATYSEINNIVGANCNSSGCHGTGSGNGDFTTYAGLKAKAESGSLKNRVVVKKDMPPAKTLSTEQIQQIECWMNNGALEN